MKPSDKLRLAALVVVAPHASVLVAVLLATVLLAIATWRGARGE